MFCSSVEDLIVQTLIWTENRVGAIVLPADNPGSRTIGFSCFVPPGTDSLGRSIGDEESSLFELPLSISQRGCDQWIGDFKTPSNRRLVASLFMSDRARIHKHVK